jgi:hypothetical protein
LGISGALFPVLGAVAGFHIGRVCPYCDMASPAC